MLPIGTQLIYNVTFTPGWVSPTATPASIAAAVAANVSKNSGISVVGTNASSNAFALSAAFTLTLSLNQAYTSAAMVQSVMDSAVAAASGGVAASNITVSGTPAAPAASNAPVAAGAPTAGTPAGTSDTDLATWLTNNWEWLLISAGALLVVTEVI